jgi:hypothetical protein
MRTHYRNRKLKSSPKWCIFLLPPCGDWIICSKMEPTTAFVLRHPSCKFHHMKNIPYLHAVASTRFHAPLFQNPSHAYRLWSILKKNFQNAISACLMPDHIHLIQMGDAAQIQVQLQNILNAIGQSWGLGKNSFHPVPIPQIIPNAHHLLRSIRYLHLNPCREKLVDDPLSWPYSTHLDFLGLRLNPWLSPQSALKLIQMDPKKFHAYVSGDPTVKVESSLFPTSIGTQNIPRFGLIEHQEAVKCLHFHQPSPLAKLHLLALLMDQGFTQTAFLCRHLNLGRHQVARMKHRLPLPGTTLSLLKTYLNDSRLRGQMLHFGADSTIPPGGKPISAPLWSRPSLII